MIYYFFYRRECEVDMYVGNIKNMQLSRSSLIPNEHYILKFLSMDSSFFHSLYGVVNLFFYVIFIVFGSSGFSFFGAEMLKKYLFQPIMPKPEEHVLAKTVLRETSEAIIEKGRMVYSINDDLKQNRHRMTNVEASTKLRIMKKKIQEIEDESAELKEMLEIFNKENEFENENPLVYVVYGALGLTCYFLGFFFLINNYYLVSRYYSFTDNTYFILRTYLGQGFTYFFFIFSFVIITISILKGYDKMSKLVPDWILENYKIEEDMTWTDNFLAISNLLIVFTLSSKVGMARMFPTYFANTGLAYLFFLNLPSVYPMNQFFYYYYPNVFFIIFYMVGFFIVFFEPAPKEKLIKLIEEKKEDLKEKQEVIKENPDLI